MAGEERRPPEAVAGDGSRAVDAEQTTGVDGGNVSILAFRKAVNDLEGITRSLKADQRRSRFHAID